MKNQKIEEFKQMRLRRKENDEFVARLENWLRDNTKLIMRNVKIYHSNRFGLGSRFTVNFLQIIALNNQRERTETVVKIVWSSKRNLYVVEAPCFCGNEFEARSFAERVLVASDIIGSGILNDLTIK